MMMIRTVARPPLSPLGHHQMEVWPLITSWQPPTCGDDDCDVDGDGDGDGGDGDGVIQVMVMVMAVMVVMIVMLMMVKTCENRSN